SVVTRPPAAEAPARDDRSAQPHGKPVAAPDEVPPGPSHPSNFLRNAAGKVRKEAARQSATDAGPQAFYDQLALSRLKRWGGTSSESQANPGGQITDWPPFDNGVTPACLTLNGNFHRSCQVFVRRRKRLGNGRRAQPEAAPAMLKSVP